ncbi:unnamed protein product [Sphagnum compactum]
MAEGGGSSGVVMVEALLYHEVQESRLCAVHCVNAVLQGPYFSEVDLASMAQDLDQQEQQVMLESGAGSSHYLNFMAEGSSNVAADGNFSIQVLNRALEIWSLQCISLEAPEAEEARLSPHKQKAFICNLQAHWFCIRKVGDRWYNFNSLYPAPQHLSNFYLSAYLDTLKTSGWSIFVVQGSLPSPNHWATDGGYGRWLTPEEADNITRAAKKADVEKSKTTIASSPQKIDGEKLKIGSANLAAALAASLPSAPAAASVSFADSKVDDEEDDPEYAAALAACFADINPPPSFTQQAPQLQLQPPDAASLAKALAESFFSAASASGLNLPCVKPPSNKDDSQ